MRTCVTVFWGFESVAKFYANDVELSPSSCAGWNMAKLRSNCTLEWDEWGLNVYGGGVAPSTSASAASSAILEAVNIAEARHAYLFRVPDMGKTYPENQQYRHRNALTSLGAQSATPQAFQFRLSYAFITTKNAQW